MRLALIEGVLAAIGGALGVVASVWILQGILAMLPPFTLASTVDPKLNLQVLLFALGATMFAGALSGSAQAWQAGRTNFNDTLKQAGRGGTGHGRRRLLHALVVVEFALAVTLLGGAGLTILSFWNRTQVDLGVRTDQILTFGLPVNEGRFSSPLKSTFSTSSSSRSSRPFLASRRPASARAFRCWVLESPASSAWSDSPRISARHGQAWGSRW